MVEASKFDEMANTYFFANDLHKSLLYSFLALRHTQSDWAVVRLAAAACSLHGPQEAFTIMEEFNSHERGFNFRLGRAHYAELSGARAAAVSAADDVLESLPSDRVNLDFVATLAAIFCGSQKITQFEWVVSKFVRQFLEHPWAFYKVAACAREVLFRQREPKFFQALAKEALRCASITHVQDKELRGYLHFLDEVLGFEILTKAETELEREFRHFVRRYPLQLHCSIAVDALDGPKFISAEDLYERAVDALQADRGFSFVRMGDGEGRFVGGLEEFPEIDAKSRDVASRIWFWNSASWPGDAFFKGLRESYVNADVVGINPHMRVSLEAHNSPLGYAGVVLGNDFVVRNGRRGQKLTHNWNTVALDRFSAYEKLVQLALGLSKKVCIICPHEDIIKKVTWLDNDHVSVLLLPSEGHSAVSGASAERPPHFPDVFEHVKKAISANPGSLFLVAGGVFGKLYCEIARSQGAVSLDIGSLVDVWAGIKTR